jgi:hypothetical protein
MVVCGHVPLEPYSISYSKKPALRGMDRGPRLRAKVSIRTSIVIPHRLSSVLLRPLLLIRCVSRIYFSDRTGKPYKDAGEDYQPQSDPRVSSG